jgi:hypothetical protein
MNYVPLPKKTLLSKNRVISKFSKKLLVEHMGLIFSFKEASYHSNIFP